MADAKSYFISGPILTITNDQNHVTIGNFISFIYKSFYIPILNRILQHISKDEEITKRDFMNR